MSTYPDLPDNRLIVNGVDLSVTYQMVLLDGYTLEPPEPKTYTVDIPGGNGVIDLTEALNGDVVYNNRHQEFEFALINVENFEKVKTELSNFLHGKAFDYTMTMDPGYTYHGRFSVSSYSHSAYSSGLLGNIKISIDANPYKTKGTVSKYLDCAGGVWVKLLGSRRPQYPKITLGANTRIEYKDSHGETQVLQMGAGIYTIRKFKISNIPKEVYINSKRFYMVVWDEAKSKTWESYKEYTWDSLHKTKLDDTQFVEKRSWDNLFHDTWDSLSKFTWSRFTQNVEKYNSNVIIEFEKEDL